MLKVEAEKTAEMNGHGAATQVEEVRNLWKQWLTATADSWWQTGWLAAETVRLTPRWFAMLAQIRHNLFAAEGYPRDPLQLATRWYNATNGPLSDFLSHLTEREAVLEVSSRSLQDYATFYRIFRDNSEKYLRGFSLPVRSDITRLAGLLISSDDKIDRLEETVEDSHAEILAKVEEISDRLEGALNDGTETSLNSATVTSGGISAKRLDDLEAKMDLLLGVLQSVSQDANPRGIETTWPDPPGVRATEAAMRMAHELGIDLASLEGTGTAGRITVHDVRRKGEAR